MYIMRESLVAAALDEWVQGTDGQAGQGHADLGSQQHRNLLQLRNLLDAVLVLAATFGGADEVVEGVGAVTGRWGQLQLWDREM